ncbi:MAG: substrate-binding domain-containing protein [Clostridia bacterium]|nr:substrate-binding domain-containing protein [Clostridia bacterium]
MKRIISRFSIIMIIICFLSACSNSQQIPQNDSVQKSEIKTEAKAEAKAGTAVEAKPELKAEKQPVKEYHFSKDLFSKVDGSTATIPLSEGIAEYLLELKKPEVKKLVRHNTTHNAYVNLVEGNADIILVTEPSDEEFKLAKDKNIELDVIPVVKDAFVFLVNTKNPVDSLKLKEIQGIYQGKIKKWSEVGGNNLEIIPYQRPKNSGSQTSMENIVMKGLKLMDAPKELKPEAMEGLIEKVAGYDNSERALGYSVYYYAHTMYSKNTIKLIGVDGIKPDKETIMSGKYPLTSAYYAVLRKNEPANSPARQLLEWLLSDEGQILAEKCGYIRVK